jgi:hypothetical protein
VLTTPARACQCPSESDSAPCQWQCADPNLGSPIPGPGPEFQLPVTVPIDTPTGIGVQPEAGPRRPGAGGSESPAEIPTRRGSGRDPPRFKSRGLHAAAFNAPRAVGHETPPCHCQWPRRWLWLWQRAIFC